ncbi:MAG: acyl-CoA/acyl-ACP dehydrogenase [Actinomycetota bacterium]|nr:acyl-CoA/acyl-ACP dehydrogenase [Actinomycetota bacterium]
MSGLLAEARGTLERLLPGLDAELAELPLEQLESRESGGIELFRQSGGPALLVPKQHGGIGATALEAVQVQLAIGSRSPSLAIASTMHHFSVASLVGMDEEEGPGFEWMLLQGIAEGNRLLASGFAEGRSGQGVFKPSMTARPAGDGYVVSGSKRPCSLAYSMDLLTASVELVDGDGRGNGGDPRFAVAVIASDLPGVEIEPFWNAPVLAGAQSEAVVLDDVRVDSQLVVEMGTVADGHLHNLQAKGLMWFETLMTAGYLGVAAALVDELIGREKGDPSVRALAAIEIDAGIAALEGVCARIAAGEKDDRMLARSLACRYGVQDAITRAVAMAVEQLGGIAFIGGPDVAYMASASRAIGLHPPSRSKSLPVMVSGLTGEGLDLS